MSASAVTLKYLLLAEDKASSVMKKTGKEVDDTGGKVSKMSKTSKVALLGLAGAAVGFGSASISKFRQVTSESRGLQRALGGTLEEASRFREAAILSGVDAGTFTKSMQKLDKTLVTAAGSTKGSAAMAKTLGMNFLDAHGKVLPMSTLLPKLSDKFESMPDGADKTALAMKLFGKAGAAMLPFLGKGSAGIADLEKQSDKFGTTLSGNAIDAVTKANVSQREWTATMDGLKVQIGAQLLPIMTKLVSFIRDHIMPIVQKVTTFVKQHKDAVGLAVAIIGTLVVGIKAWTIAQGILNTVMALNPIGMVVIAIAALAAGFIYAWKKSETFRDIIKGAFAVVHAAAKAVADFFTQKIPAAWNTVVSALRSAWNKTFQFIKTWGPLALAVLVPFIGIPLLIWQHWSAITGFLVRVWNTVWPYLKKWGPLALSVLVPFIGIPLLIWQHWKAITGFLVRVWNTVWPYLKKWGPAALSVLVPFIGIPLLIWQHFSKIKGYVSSAFSAAYGQVKSWVGLIVSFIRGLPAKIGSVAAGMASSGGRLISSLFKGIENGLTGAGQWAGNLGAKIVNAIRNTINSFLHLPIKLPHVNTHIPGVGTIGGETLIPKFAQGTGFFPGGLGVVGDAGPEIVNLPPGAQIKSSSAARSRARMGGGGVTEFRVTVQGGLVTEAAVQRAIGAALEYYVRGGNKLNIAKGIH